MVTERGTVDTVNMILEIENMIVLKGGQNGSPAQQKYLGCWHRQPVT